MKHPLDNTDQLNLHDDVLALKLWDGSNVSLNEAQKQAIHLGLKNKFQLIQGPPGKTVILLLLYVPSIQELVKVL